MAKPPKKADRFRKYCRQYRPKTIVKHLRSMPDESLEIAKKLLTITHDICAVNARTFILSIMAHTHMKLKDYMAVCEVLNKFKEMDESSSARNHYYYYCITFNLYTGVTIMPIYQILPELEKLEDSEKERPIAIALALFFLRRKKQIPLTCKYILEQISKAPQEITINNVDYELMYLEYILLRAIQKLNFTNPNTSNKQDIRISINDELFKIDVYLTSIRQIVPAYAPYLYPRYLLLKAYSLLIKDHLTQAISILTTALKICLNQNNKLDYDWIQLVLYAITPPRMQQSMTAIYERRIVIDYNIWVQHTELGHHVLLDDYKRYKPEELLYIFPALNLSALH